MHESCVTTQSREVGHSDGTHDWAVTCVTFWKSKPETTWKASVTLWRWRTQQDGPSAACRDGHHGFHGYGSVSSAKELALVGVWRHGPASEPDARTASSIPRDPRRRSEQVRNLGDRGERDQWRGLLPDPLSKLRWVFVIVVVVIVMRIKSTTFWWYGRRRRW